MTLLRKTLALSAVLAVAVALLGLLPTTAHAQRDESLAYLVNDTGPPSLSALVLVDKTGRLVDVDVGTLHSDASLTTSGVDNIAITTSDATVNPVILAGTTVITVWTSDPWVDNAAVAPRLHVLDGTAFAAIELSTVVTPRSIAVATESATVNAITTTTGNADALTLADEQGSAGHPIRAVLSTDGAGNSIDEGNVGLAQTTSTGTIAVLLLAAFAVVVVAGSRVRSRYGGTDDASHHVSGRCSQRTR